MVIIVQTEALIHSLARKIYDFSALSEKKRQQFLTNLDTLIKIKVADELKSIDPQAAKAMDPGILARLNLHFYAQGNPEIDHGIDFDKLADIAKITDPGHKELLRTMTLHSLHAFKAKQLLEVSRVSMQDSELIKLAVADIQVQANMEAVDHKFYEVIRSNPANVDINAAIKAKADAVQPDPIAAFVLAHRMVNPKSKLSDDEKAELVKYQQIYESNEKTARSGLPVEHIRSQDVLLRSLVGEEFSFTFKSVREITQQSFTQEIHKPNQALAINLGDLLKDNRGANDARKRIADYGMQLLGLNKKTPDTYAKLNYIAKILKQSGDDSKLLVRINTELKDKSTHSNLKDELEVLADYKPSDDESVKIFLPIRLTDGTELQLINRPILDSLKRETVLVVSKGDKLIELSADFVASMESRRAAGYPGPLAGPCMADYEKAISKLAEMETDNEGKSVVSGANQLAAIEVIKLIGYSRTPANLVNSGIFEGPRGEAVTNFMQTYVKEHSLDSVEIYALAKRLCDNGKEARLVQSLLYQLEINSQRRDTSAEFKAEAKSYIEDKAQAELWLTNGEAKASKKKSVSAPVGSAMGAVFAYMSEVVLEKLHDETIKMFHLMDLVANTMSAYRARTDLNYHELSADEYTALKQAEANHLDLRRQLIEANQPVSADLREQIGFRDYEYRSAHGLEINQTHF